ncbi:MAG: oligosaccharide flippase family protein, partial [Pseudomonadota bacterium]
MSSIRTLSIYGLSAVIAALLPILVLPILANTMGPQDFGLFTAARFTMQLACFFVGSFLGFGLSRVFFDRTPEAYYGLINGANLTTLGLGLILFWVATVGFSGTDLPDDQPIITVICTIFVGAVGFVWRQNYHRILVMISRAGLAASTEVFFNALIFGGFLLLSWLGFGWVAMLGVQAAIFVVTAFISACIIAYLVGTKGMMSLDVDWTLQNFRRSGPFIVVGLVTPLLLTIDKYIIAAVLGAEQMGVYASTAMYLSKNSISDVKFKGTPAAVNKPGKKRATTRKRAKAKT